MKILLYCIAYGLFIGCFTTAQNAQPKSKIGENLNLSSTTDSVIDQGFVDAISMTDTKKNSSIFLSPKEVNFEKAEIGINLFNIITKTSSAQSETVFLVKYKKIDSLIFDNKKFNIEISKELDYFTVTSKIDVNNTKKTFYSVELRNIENITIATAEIEEIGSFESSDKIYPISNGKYIIQESITYNGKIYFNVYQVQLNRLKLIRKFVRNNITNGIYKITNQNLCLSYDSIDNLSNSKITHLEYFSLEGKLIWKTQIQGIRILVELSLSEYDIMLHSLINMKVSMKEI